MSGLDIPKVSKPSTCPDGHIRRNEMSETYATEAPPKFTVAELRAGNNMVPAKAGFDLDYFHAMEERDNALIADEVLSGSLSSTFVYNFPGSDGKPLVGISVVGARHLAHKYGKIKHRILGSILKKGSMFIFTNYPHDGTPFNITVSSLPEMREEMDFYKVLIEISDLSTGNSIQIEKMETTFEMRRDKSGYYERKHVEAIAQSKAFRNGLLALLPQDIVESFKAECLKISGKTLVITENVLDAKRSNVIGYAIRNAIPIDRAKLSTLTMSQIAGLSAAAHEDGLETFTRALTVLGISGNKTTDVPTAGTPPATAGRAPDGAKAAKSLKKPAEPQPTIQTSQNEPPKTESDDPGPSDTAGDEKGEGQGGLTPEREQSKQSTTGAPQAGGLFGEDSDFGNMD
jgi:hypothetical protein